MNGNLEILTGFLEKLKHLNTMFIVIVQEKDDMIFILIGDTYPGILTIKNDTLILDHSFMDLDKQFYVRKGK